MDPFSALATPFTHNFHLSTASLLFHAALTHVCLDFVCFFCSDQQVKAVKVEEKKREKEKEEKKEKGGVHCSLVRKLIASQLSF